MGLTLPITILSRHPRLFARTILRSHYSSRSLFAIAAPVLTVAVAAVTPTVSLRATAPTVLTLVAGQCLQFHARRQIERVASASCPGARVYIGLRVAVAASCARAAKDGQVEKRPEGRHRACYDANTFFDDGPEADGTGAVHEFGLIVVEG